MDPAPEGLFLAAVLGVDVSQAARGLHEKLAETGLAGAEKALPGRLGMGREALPGLGEAHRREVEEAHRGKELEVPHRPVGRLHQAPDLIRLAVEQALIVAVVTASGLASEQRGQAFHGQSFRTMPTLATP